MRRADWDLRLAEEVRAAGSRRFKWGSHDCAAFAIRCERAMCGASVFGDLKMNYRSKRGAARVIRRIAPNLIAAVDTRRAAVAVAMAQRGDWLAMMTPEGPVLGVCLGARGGFLDEDGLALRPVADCLKGWRID